LKKHLLKFQRKKLQRLKRVLLKPAEAAISEEKAEVEGKAEE